LVVDLAADGDPGEDNPDDLIGCSGLAVAPVLAAVVASSR
jgi:hypothetical protein